MHQTLCPCTNQWTPRQVGDAVPVDTSRFSTRNAPSRKQASVRYLLLPRDPLEPRPSDSICHTLSLGVLVFCIEVEVQPRERTHSQTRLGNHIPKSPFFPAELCPQVGKWDPTNPQKGSAQRRAAAEIQNDAGGENLVKACPRSEPHAGDGKSKEQKTGRKEWRSDRRTAI